MSPEHEFSTADVVTAGKERVGVIRGLSAAWAGASVAGPAFTVCGKSGDNLALHRALAEAPAGTVIVAELDGEVPAGHWGELMAIAAVKAGIRGAVVAGTIRDLSQIRSREFPIFFEGTAPNPAAKEHPGVLSAPVSLRGVVVHPGDLVVADVDGVAIVPQKYVAAVHEDVQNLQAREREFIRLVSDGRTTIEVLQLETPTTTTVR